MRILLVTFPGKGGIQTQSQMKAEGLAKRGHEVIVLVTHNLVPHDKGKRRVRRQGRITTVHMGSFRCGKFALATRSSFWLQYTIDVMKEIVALHQADPIDLVDFYETLGVGYAFLLNRTSSNYIPAVIQLHAPIAMFSKLFNKPRKGSLFYVTGIHMEKIALELADAVFSSSACSVRWCKQDYGIRGNIPVLHTGVDTKLFSPGSQSLQNNTVVFLGSLRHSKGIETLVRAIALLLKKHKDLKLELIGQDDGVSGFSKHLKTLSKKISKSKFLSILSDLPRVDIPNHLRKAKIFALPSVYEAGPSFATLEAMACGLPVVVSNVGGFKDYVKHNQNGLMVSPDNVEALAKSIDRLLRDPALREKLGKNAREYVLKNANSEKCILQIEKFYSSIARQKQKVVQR